MYIDYSIKNIYLKDINDNGNEVDWKGKKIETIALSESYNRLDKISKSERVENCGTFLEFILKKDDTLKLTNTNFCKVRLCPMCSWRRSLKIFGQVSKVMDYIEENHNLEYVFLTLTIKNCFAEDLKNTLDSMTKAFNYMTRRKEFKKSVKGYFRSLEITYNKKDNTYHPHFHIILGVNSYYFSCKDYYITQRRWSEIWQESLKVDYVPIADIRKVKKNKDYSSAVAEVAKYTVKSSDYLIKDEDGNIIENLTDEVVATLDKALHRKRLVSFGFLFKEVHNLLNLDDAENGDLINTDNEDLREDLTDIILRYSWNVGLKNYVLIEVE